MQDFNVILSQKERKHGPRSDSIGEASEDEENNDSGDINKLSLSIKTPQQSKPTPDNHQQPTPLKDDTTP